MTATSQTSLMEEFHLFFERHPDIEYLDAITFDMNGIVRGKRYPRRDCLHLFEKGMQLPYSVMALDIRGNSSGAGGVGFGDGDPDGVLTPVPGTLVTIPWADVPMAQAMFTYRRSNGSDAMLEPRNILASVEERLNADGLFPVAALELEFYLIDRERTRDGRPQAPISPKTGERDTATQVYGMAEMDSYGAILRDIENACEDQNIPAYTATAEYAPGQFEVNLMHTDSAVAAADHASLLTRVVMAIAEKHGMRATFMAKPFTDMAGNGMHIHLSLLDGAGRNLFDDGDDNPFGADTLRHAIGGLKETLVQSMAVFAPNRNAFRRFRPNIYVPIGATWGVNNRSLAFRIPTGDGASRRVEHRVAGADANPYLALAAVMAGVHHGIKNKIDPGTPDTGNASAEFGEGMPHTIDEALYGMADGAILKDYFGERYVDVYTLTKKAELDSYREHISGLEYDWYL